MSTARDTVLQHIRAALRDVPPGERSDDVAFVRGYRRRDDTSHDAVVAQFVERVEEYKAHVRRVEEGQLVSAIAEALQACGVRRLVVPHDLPQAWLPETVTILCDHGDLSFAALDASDGVLTACALGIAQTGTIVLDHGALQGRRALTLVPDYHLCVIRAEQLVGLVPKAFEILEGASRVRRPLTFISGPSATSDIELSRVEGVHGPRTLEVLLVVALDNDQPVAIPS